MAASLLFLAIAAAHGAPGPCDLLAAAGNPCVAAHSTTRSLFSAFNGALYEVMINSTGATANVTVLQPGGFANASAHDAFCAALDCVISRVFDQSPMANHLHQRHKLVNASLQPALVGDGVKVYGMRFDPGFGYHQDQTNGIALGNEPESIYAVMSGTHYNGACCFDYGNSETDDTSDGAGSMEAIYFGNAHWQGNSGGGDGPWVGADLECGMYYGGANLTQVNTNNKPLPHEFVSLALRGRVDGFALKGANAQAGAFAVMYDGPRPDCAIAGTCHRHGNHTYQVRRRLLSTRSCFARAPGTRGTLRFNSLLPSPFNPRQPMNKKGAIILGTGGDSSNGAMGRFCTSPPRGAVGIAFSLKPPPPSSVRPLLRRRNHGDGRND
jgi:hypothetical protein